MLDSQQMRKDAAWYPAVRTALRRPPGGLAAAADVKVLQHLAPPAFTCRMHSQNAVQTTESPAATVHLFVRMTQYKGGG